MANNVLEICGLTIDFPKTYGRIGLVRDVDLTIAAGECLGLVGESGSGKTLLGLSIMGLQPPGAEVSGSVLLGGRQLIGLGAREWRSVRGSDLAMIYQDALLSLNPGMRVGRQIEQAMRGVSGRTAAEMLEAVRIRDIARCLHSYPHELSGGQRQRVLIAMAISRQPRLVIADEPTTALDVTVQAQIVSLLTRLRQEQSFALLFISHDLGLVSRVADRVAVMYAGDIVETGDTRSVLTAPRHPYTLGLLEASRSVEEGREKLAQIPGVVPPPTAFAAACRFAPRCPYADELSRTERPRLKLLGDRLVACHHPLGVDARRTDETNIEVSR